MNVYQLLSPEIIINCVEIFLDVFLDGTIIHYNSYINRVYGVKDENENSYIIKFYRPNRWNKETLFEEHKFLQDCVEGEVDVVAPLVGKNGLTLGEVELEEGKLYFAVFPRIRARTFDIYTEEDWIRTGRGVGRLHMVSKKEGAINRLQCTPRPLSCEAWWREFSVL